MGRHARHGGRFAHDAFIWYALVASLFGVKSLSSCVMTKVMGGGRLALPNLSGVLNKISIRSLVREAILCSFIFARS